MPSLSLLCSEPRMLKWVSSFLAISVLLDSSNKNFYWLQFTSNIYFLIAGAQRALLLCVGGIFPVVICICHRERGGGNRREGVPIAAHCVSDSS